MQNAQTVNIIAHRKVSFMSTNTDVLLSEGIKHCSINVELLKKLLPFIKEPIITPIIINDKYGKRLVLFLLFSENVLICFTRIIPFLIWICA